MKLDSIPKSPGVYLMKSDTGTILYVGKAKNLAARIRQYFAGQDNRPQVPHLLSHVTQVETLVVTSEKEALLLEDTLIKKHRPKYNILLKDDKSYASIKLTRHDWPRLQLVRYKGPPPSDGTYFGPYMNAEEARRTLDLLNRYFPLRQCSDQELARRKRPCILYQMRRCVAPCCHLCTPDEYAKLVKQTTQFLKGKDKELLQSLYEEMEKFSKNLEFEKAAMRLRTIKQVEHALETQAVNFTSRIDIDVVGLYREGDELSLVQLFFREGKLTGQELFHFSAILQDDEEVISSFLIQHYAHKDYAPKEIFIPLSIQDLCPLQDILQEGKNHKITIHYPQRGKGRKLLEMAYTNAKAGFAKEKDSKTLVERSLLQMQEKLFLGNYPHLIDCIDTAHLQGYAPVSAAVRFVEGKSSKTDYRLYNLKETPAGDDYAALFEVLMRRYSKAKEEGLPNLLLIDGGKGQLGVAKRVFAKLNITTIDLLSIAKEEGRHDKGIAAEKIFHPEKKDAILLSPHSPILFLLQQIRDEAHRFVITAHRKKRTRGTIYSSLQTIAGIGPIKQKRLLRTFKSIKRIKEASIDELKAVKGITQADIEALQTQLATYPLA